MMLALLLAAAQPAETPQRFLERVYLSYNSPGFSPLEHPARWFTPRLVAAIREDSRLAHGEVGYLDGDPLCDCQDSDEIAMAINRLSRASRTRSIAKVHLNIGIREMRDLTLSLRRTTAGWRIADVSSADEASLLAALEQANRKVRGRH